MKKADFSARSRWITQLPPVLIARNSLFGAFCFGLATGVVACANPPSFLKVSYGSAQSLGGLQGATGVQAASGANGAQAANGANGASSSSTQAVPPAPSVTSTTAAEAGNRTGDTNAVATMSGPNSPPATQASPAQDEALPSVSAAPDVIGIRPGMTLDETVSILKKHNPNFTFQDSQGKGVIATFVGPKVPNGAALLETGDRIAVLATPNPPHLVFSITRWFKGITDPADLMARFNEKYGRPKQNFGMWAFDKQGKLLPERDCFEKQVSTRSCVEFRMELREQSKAGFMVALSSATLSARAEQESREAFKKRDQQKEQEFKQRARQNRPDL